MHVDEVLCHEENGRTTWETSHPGCIKRKVISKEVTSRGRFHFFLDSACLVESLCYIPQYFGNSLEYVHLFQI